MGEYTEGVLRSRRDLSTIVSGKSIRTAVLYSYRVRNINRRPITPLQGCHPLVYYPGTLWVYPDGYYPPPGPGPTSSPPGFSGRVPGNPFSNVSPWSACLTITFRNPSNTQETTQRNTRTSPTSCTHAATTTIHDHEYLGPGTHLATCPRGQHARQYLQTPFIKHETNDPVQQAQRLN